VTRRITITIEGNDAQGDAVTATASSTSNTAGPGAIADQITILATRLTGMWSAVDPSSTKPRSVAR
jgi:hypothetical protein